MFGDAWALLDLVKDLFYLLGLMTTPDHPTPVVGPTRAPHPVPTAPD